MFKRVTIICALLFANTAGAQTFTSESGVLFNENTLDKPVVTVSTATGTILDVEPTGTSILLTPPAEVSTSTVVTSSSTLVISGVGASSTSSTTTVSTTTRETEESTETTQGDKEKLFDLVYAGFQEFVRITLGWE